METKTIQLFHVATKAGEQKTAEVEKKYGIE